VATSAATTAIAGAAKETLLWMRALFRMAGTFMTTSEMVLARKMIAEQMMRAVVGRISNSAGHNEMMKSALRCVLLYTESVSADVPRIVREARTARRVRAKRVDSTMRAIRCLFSYPASLSNSWKSETNSGFCSCDAIVSAIINDEVLGDVMGLAEDMGNNARTGSTAER